MSELTKEQNFVCNRYDISRSVEPDGEPVYVLTRISLTPFGSAVKELARNKSRAVLEKGKTFLEGKDE